MVLSSIMATGWFVCCVDSHNNGDHYSVNRPILGLEPMGRYRVWRGPYPAV